MATVVRDARPDELDAARVVTRAAYAEYAQAMEPGSWQGLRQAIDAALADPGEAQWIVARDDAGEIVGSVLLYPAAANAYGDLSSASACPELRLLSVSPSARRSGVGRALVDECVRRARAMGAAALGLHTSRSMAVARGMYERLGFRRTPDTDIQPPGAELVEGYRLDFV